MRSSVAVLVSGLAAVVLLACGPAQAPANSATDGGQPRSGGVLRTWVTADPTSWDTTITGTSSVSDRWRARAYEPVLRFKHGPGVEFTQLEVEPNLAERWEASKDGRSYTFHLRRGIKWQDVPPVNGRELTSADVRFSWEYGARVGEFAEAVKEKKLKPGRFRWWFEGLESIHTPDNYTVIVTFKEPFAPFLNYAAHTKNGIYAREVYDREGHFEDTLIGTGLFILDTQESQRGTRWVMRKNSDYWMAGMPYLDGLRGIVTSSAATAFAAFQTKQIDLLGQSGHDIGHEDIQQVIGSVPDAVVYKYQAGGPQHMYVNVRKPPFDDVRVRRALNLALDRDEFIKVMTGGEGKLGIAGAFPDTFTQEEIRQIYRHDPEQSKRLLAEAGYPNGFDIEFLASAAYGSIYLTQAELLQSQLKKVGIRTTIKSLDHPAYLAQTRGTVQQPGGFDIAIRGKSMQGDVDSYLYQVWHPSSPNNYAAIEDPKLTAIVEAQRKELDPAKRREMVRDAIRLIADQVYNLALFYEVNNDVWRPYVKNFTPHWGTDGWPVRNVWLDK